MSTPEVGEPSIQIGGFGPWLPLPIDGDGEEFLQLVEEHFADDPVPVELRRASAEALVDVGRQVRELDSDDALAVAAWVLLAGDGSRLEPQTLATLVANRVEPGSTATDFIERMTEEVTLYQPPTVEDIETRSGPATMVRLRRYVGKHPDVQLSEVVAIFWMSATMDVAFVLSTPPIDDLVLAADVADAMIPLAESVEGL